MAFDQRGVVCADAVRCVYGNHRRGRVDFAFVLGGAAVASCVAHARVNGVLAVCQGTRYFNLVVAVGVGLGGDGLACALGVGHHQGHAAARRYAFNVAFDQRGVVCADAVRCVYGNHRRGRVDFAFVLGGAAVASRVAHARVNGVHAVCQGTRHFNCIIAFLIHWHTNCLLISFTISYNKRHYRTLRRIRRACNNGGVISSIIRSINRNCKGFNDRTRITNSSTLSVVRINNNS